MTTPKNHVSVLPGKNASFCQYPPSTQLRGLVETYWSLEVTEPPFTVDVVPDGMIDITLELGGAGGVWLTGARTSPASYTHHHPIHLLGASLCTGSAPPLLGVAAKDLPSEWCPLATVIGPVATMLSEQINAKKPMSDRMAVLDAFFLSRASLNVPDQRIYAAIQVIQSLQGGIGIQSLSRKAGASSRNLGRLFDEWVGMSPKKFSRIVRTQTALRRLMEEPNLDLSRLAAELGFSDHAHLTRELRALTGVNPSDLIQKFKA